ASSGLSQDEIDRMKKEAEANAASDKAEKEKIDKLNQADSLIFQTEKQLKEFGDKLSDSNKAAVSEALEKLKSAHQSQDLAAIEPAMEGLNKAWEGASQEMYNATQGGAAQGAGAAGADSGATSDGSGDGVSDVDYEEVNDEGKK
ncbi:MAG TPA: Hsp70 family protein, partial [Cyclobacteriaceae bacterium]|nr:Hsp70 family protein [Cyclobacteriaceae bacterium]